jgi:hypothetical protein
MDVFREARVIRRGERNVMSHRIPPRRESQRAFGRDVDGIGIEFGEAAPDLPAGKEL